MRLFVFGLLAICFAQVWAGNDGVVLKINDHEVRSSEFQYIYNKNNRKSEEAYSKESLDEYMELFVKFKLKVLEAERLGLDTASTFIKELEGYRKQLAKPYLTEPDFIDKMTKEAYERMKFEIKSSHILINASPEGEPSDTLKAYNKALEILKEIKAGADFGEAAFKYSQDPSAQRPEGSPGHKGELGYFTALGLVYPFESAAYNAKVGDVVGPVRTRFGYHLIKVEDRRISQGKVLTAHIMVQAAEGIATEDSIAAKRKIDEIYSKVTAQSKDWNQLCSQYSDDVKTKNKGGEMFAFSMNGKLGVPSYEIAAFALENAGDVSKPIRTPYGWHIIKLIEKQPIGSYEELKDDLKRKVSRDSRAQLDKELLYTRLKKENNFSEVQKSIDLALDYSDSTLLKGNWKIPTVKKAKKTIITIDGVKYSVNDFFQYVEKNQMKKKGISPRYAMTLLFNQYTNETVYKYEESNLTKKHYDYKMLTKEYRDGILLFKLMEEKVWNKASKDTTGLKEFYEEHKDDFFWNERLDAVVYSLNDKNLLPELKAEIAQGKSDIELKNKFNKESSLMLSIKKDKFEKGENKYVDQAQWKAGTYEIVEGDQVYLIVVNELLPKTYRTLTDSKGIIISEYQNYLEDKWIKELKSQYQIDINKEILYSLVK